MKLSSVQVSRKRGWYRVILDSDQVRAEFVGHARRIYDTAQVCGIWLQEVAEFQCDRSPSCQFLTLVHSPAA